LTFDPELVTFVINRFFPAMAKKFHLETRSEPTLFTLLGISAHIKDYRLSYMLNRQLELAFIKMDDLVVSSGQKGTPEAFSLYHTLDEDHFNTYYLLSNRGQESVLVPELKQTDFLLLIEGPFKKSQSEALSEKIRSIPQVLACFEIRFSTLKNIENLLTDLEIHFTNIIREGKTKYPSIKK